MHHLHHPSYKNSFSMVNNVLCRGERSKSKGLFKQNTINQLMFMCNVSPVVSEHKESRVNMIPIIEAEIHRGQRYPLWCNQRSDVPLVL